MLSRAARATTLRSAARATLPRAAPSRTFFSSSAPKEVQSDPNESVPLPEVERLLLHGIKSIGYNEADAIVMKDAMMWAQLRDNNQGIIKLTSGGLAKSGDAEPSIEYDTPSGARVNGNQAMSMVVLDRAVRLAIEKAQRSNVGIVGTFNTSQSCGALGFYTEKIASAGLIGLVFATSPEFVAPFGAKQPILGTNPIACGVPTDQGLLLIDQATAAFPWFGLLEAKTAGIEIPEGVAYDSEGNPTRDPNKALKGALRTFDRGYKSSNLALMVELLAGPLVGAAHMNKLAAKNWGNLVVAVNPGMLGEPAKFYKAAGEVLERVRTAQRLPGVDEIVIPGQREAKLAAERVRQGSVPLEKNMLAELRVLAANYEAAVGAGGASLSAAPLASAGGSGDAARTNQLLEQLLTRLDHLESKVSATAQQQQALGQQQQRLETVTIETLRSANDFKR